tara:strand:- start:1531 stop:2283 length:753 start_codon:yes stop_codon:yes gene_type:complete
MIITPINSTESAVHLNGYVTGATSGVKDVWPISAVTATIPIPENLRLVTLSSSATTDIPTNTGAHLVNVEGLNSNYDRISDAITLNGQNAVQSTQAFIAVNSIKVVDAGTNASNNGVIYAGVGTVTSGVPATSYCVVDQEVSMSETLCFTVPRNHTLEIESVSVVPKTIATTSLLWKINKSIIVETQEVKQVIYTSMYRATQFESIQKFDTPIVFNERETLKMSVSQLNSNGDVLIYVVGKLKVIDPNDT